MSILNVNQIQPVGSGQTVTISAANITASSSTISANSFVGPLTGDATGLSGSPTLSGITSVSTTNLTVNGNAYPNAGPLSNRNLVINGAMQVAQRGTTQTTSDFGTVDRFFPSFSGGAVTTTQESLTSGDPYNEGFRNFARLTNTTALTNTATNYRLFVHRIEAQNMANSGWNYSSATSYITLSFWIRSSVSQEFIVRLRSEDGTSQNYPMSTGTLTADTWTKITKTIPGNSNVAFDNDNGRGLRIEFDMFWGTDYTDSGVSLDTWAAFSASTRAPDMTSTWATTTNATFDVTGVQLEVGSVATPFEHRSYGDELARCQRYYYKIQAKASNTSGFFANAHNRSTTSALGVTQFPVEMRTSPTALEQSGTASDYTVNHGNNQTACSSVPAWFEADTFAARTNFTTAGSLTTGQGSILRSASTNAYLAWSAEL